MSSITESRETGPAWRSLSEFESDPEFLQHLSNEFASYSPEEMRKPTRRGFLAFMGASAALAGSVGCRWPREQILPHARRPDNRTPGEPVAFATAMEINGFGHAILATSLDGRPIKIDGNDQHPLSKGKSNALMQASVLSLYDPDRSKHPVSKSARQSDDPKDSPAAKRAIANETSSWRAFLADAKKALDAAKSRDGAGIAILTETTDSVSLEFVRNKLAASYPQVRWFHWSPCPFDNVITGTKRAFGKAMRPHLQLARADVVVSIDDDFLHNHPAALRNARDFASRRDPAGKGSVSRVYSIDSAMSLTASNADVRIRVRPEQIAATIGALISEVMNQSGSGAALSEIGRQFADMKANAANAAKIKQLAAALSAAKGRSVVSIGAQHSSEAHAAVAWLNEQLGNNGKTVTYTEEPRAKHGSALESLQSLVKYINDGTVETLIMLGGNPIYDAPADLKFADALAKTKSSIHLSELDNETSRQCTWHANRAHYLESWDATRAYDGSICAVQPLIAPLYDGKTSTELVALLFDLPEKSAYEITQAALKEPLGQLRNSLSSLPNLDAAEDTLWNRFLHTGYLTTSTLEQQTTSANDVGWLNDFATTAKANSNAENFTVAFHPDRTIGSGEFANNAWLQELPDPLTKLTWDNAAVMAPSDAKTLGVKTSDNVTIDHGGQSVTLPVFILPGQVAGVVSLALGYGRKYGGAILQDAGFDVFPLRTSKTLGFAPGAKVSKASGSYLLVGTQDHHAVQSKVGDKEIQRRVPELVRTQEVADYQHNPAYTNNIVHLPQLESMWKEREFTGHRWAMSIDLSKCNGCSACITACQAENNIPVVGKQEVEMGREMHWMRIDRYFRGDPDDPDVLHQPVTCQHCELAPCESVCPVAATVHDEEGLNVMIYNRCIGTRYCSNNCPYKVRRFNWFYNHHGPSHPRSKAEGYIGFPDWQQPSMLKQKRVDSVEQMVFNPEVTVRSRGVMEKCTFCYQRIAKAKIDAKNEWSLSDPESRPSDYHIPDGAIVTACQQACPTDAIIFGDLSDPKSKVSRLQHLPRSYAMLGQLNIKPRLKYLTKMTNAGEFAKFAPLPTHGHHDAHDEHGGNGGDHGNDHETPAHDDDHGAAVGHNNTNHGSESTQH